MSYVVNEMLREILAVVSVSVEPQKEKEIMLGLPKQLKEEHALVACLEILVNHGILNRGSSADNKKVCSYSISLKGKTFLENSMSLDTFLVNWPGLIRARRFAGDKHVI